MELIAVKIVKPAAINFVLGQTHFIKTVEDIHETLVAAVPGIQFGLAFCEASGKCLVRWSGTDPVMIKLAQENAQAVAAGHSFFIFFGEGYYPINVLNALKNVAEVCSIYCATANPVEVIIAATEQGRAILGVVDGTPPKALEEEEDIAWRKGLLRQIGYSFSQAARQTGEITLLQFVCRRSVKGIPGLYRDSRLPFEALDLDFLVPSYEICYVPPNCSFKREIAC